MPVGRHIMQRGAAGIPTRDSAPRLYVSVHNKDTDRVVNLVVDNTVDAYQLAQLIILAGATQRSP